MANTITVGLSALVAAQAGISVTGKNIANAASPGYSRERIIQTEDAVLGEGTKISDIQRIYDQFLAGQKISAQSSYSHLQAQYDKIQQINNMLSDSSIGLSSYIQDFFDSLQEVSVAPSDTPSRQLFLSNIDALVSNFNQFQSFVDGIGSDVNQQIASSVDDINNIAKQIASLNGSIASVQQTSNGTMANELLDKRDNLIAELSKNVQVRVATDGNIMNIFIGNGQSLVVGTSFNKLDVIPSKSNTANVDVAFDFNGKKAPIAANQLTGGILGGLIEFRSKNLTLAQSSIGRIALGLASGMNKINHEGFTLNGTQGGDLFNLPKLSVIANADNSGTSIKVDYSDIAKLTTSDYSLKKLSGKYNLIRTSDNVLLSSESKDSLQAAANLEGLSFDINSLEKMQDGDQFLIRPTANIAGVLSVAILNINDIAAASKSGLVGDNSNVLKMIALQTDKTLNNGSLSFQNAYAKMVSDIGAKTRELALTSVSANSMLTQASTALDSVAGVNLDEESANLLRYQQAYQAAGKLIEISKVLFDTLIQLG